MENSTLLKQKANEIVETLGKLYPDLPTYRLSTEFGLMFVAIRVESPSGFESFTYSQETELFGVHLNYAKTCFGAFTKWINSEIDFHQKEIEKLVQLNTNLLGLGEKK